MPSISAIIITYNRPDELVAALDSVRNQTRRPEEVIVVDGSDRRDMATYNPEEFMAASGIFFEYVCVTNRGPAYARNTGAQTATGDLLAFLDDDDAWMPEFLECAEESLSEGPWDAFAAARLNRSSTAEWLERLHPAPRTPFALYGRNHGVSGSNLVIRRALFQVLGGYDLRLRAMQDVDLFVRLLKAGGRVRLEHRPMVFRGVGSSSHLSDVGGRPSVWRARALRRFIVKHRAVMPPLALSARALDLRLLNARLRNKSTLPVHLLGVVKSPRAYLIRVFDKVNIMLLKQKTWRRRPTSEA